MRMKDILAKVDMGQLRAALASDDPAQLDYIAGGILSVDDAPDEEDRPWGYPDDDE